MSCTGDTRVGNQISQTGWPIAAWMAVGASTARVLATASSAGSGEALQAAVLLHSYVQLGCGNMELLWQMHELFLLS